MWFEDRYKAQKEQEELEYRKRVAKILNDTFNLNYEDMHRLEPDDNDTWVRHDRVRVPDADGQVYFHTTNDGCEHYEHGPTKKHYVFCFMNNTWREYTPYRPKNTIENKICTIM